MQVLELRQLYFPTKYAIANPDEPDDKTVHLQTIGIFICLNNGFDLNLPVTLNREKDTSDFDLFFAVRLAKIAQISVGDFLDYHLSKSFNDDFEGFRAYLQLLFLRFRSLNLSPKTNEMPLLTDMLYQAVKIWISQKVSPKTKSENLRKILMKNKAVEEPFFTVLAPFFEQVPHTHLRILIAGEANQTPLFYNGTCSRFVHTFQVACDMGLVVSLKTEVRDWIVRQALN
ncbi:MAG: hypothetical protein KDC61_00150 [Saprospiraceae bacterium]|nr:hypothetical protein [Saprospiraceae bacterium]